MEKILHILRTPPDETVAGIIEALSGEEGATVLCLYEDPVSHVPIDWSRVVKDIFSHDKVICW